MKNRVERLRKELADPQAVRRMVQWGFALLTIWIGIKFILFVHQAGGEGEITLTRPRRGGLSADQRPDQP